MKRYLTCSWDFTITEIEITRETEKSYFFAGFSGQEQRRGKESHNFHQTWEAAHAYLVARTERGIADHERGVLKGRENLAMLNEMQP